MLIEVGKENEYSSEDLQSLAVAKNYKGAVTAFPTVAKHLKVVCAYNQWGMAGMAKMYICENLADMQQLNQSYGRGEAISISWYAVPSLRFVKAQTLDEWEQETKDTEESTKQAKMSNKL